MNPSPTRTLYIGLMSGTSLDGVDAALCDITTQHCQLLATQFLPYPDALKAALLTLHEASVNELEQTALVENQLSQLYALAVKQLLAQTTVDSTEVVAIGCHGQTIRHRPELGFTLQIFNPSLLTELTGISVVCDFRSRDIAAGGQGAPLVPAFHQAVFGSPAESRAILNVGGIGNITYLPAHGDGVLGFDTGPGNMLMDAWISRHLDREYDQDGAWAHSGKLLPALLERLMEEPFFALTPPKSTGRDLFNMAWLERHLHGNEAPEDVQRTLLALSVRSMTDSLQRFCPDTACVYVCGGGARNFALIEGLRQSMHPVKIVPTDSLGLGVDWVEAVAFAWLAFRCLHNQPGNLPQVTGAKGPRVLGAVYAR